MIKYLKMKNINLPKIVIVGRPNVGKSSLFNRIIGARKSIVESASGTTRDRLYADIRWKGKGFTIIDTGGFEVGACAHGDMAGLVLKQLQKGIEEADIILFVTDGIAGICLEDKELSSVLRKTSKRIYLIVNKVDNESDTAHALEFFELGLGEPYAVSAMHDRGIEILCNDLVKGIERHATKNNAQLVHVAIIGRPNVGKSSYLNSILSEERVIVHPVAGTTRDAVDTDFNYKGRDYRLIDTAGIRHNAKDTKGPADFYGSVRSKEAIKACDVAIVLLDGYEGLTKDDARIIDLCLKEGKALVIAVNKWDLVKGYEVSKYSDRLKGEMRVIRNFPVVFISCKTGRGVKASLDVIWSVYEKSKMIIQSDKIAETLKSLNNRLEISNKRIKFKYLIQEGTMPLRFILGVKSVEGLSENLKRFIENFFRMAYDFDGIPIRIRFEKQSKTDN